jgi:hypothetical protein
VQPIVSTLTVLSDGTNRFKTRKWKKKGFLCDKRLSINDDLVYKKIINCTNVADLKNTVQYLHKSGCKYESEISEI